MNELSHAESTRTADHPIEDLILRRWSPRAMNSDAITDDEMLRLFEAARWAPSTYNEQEWRFLYARRETAEWSRFFALLTEANQAWCKNAAMLVAIVAHTVFAKNGNANPVHLFDCESAFENLSLQGTAMGLVVHGMSGFDYEAARTSLAVPDRFAVAAMFAVGHPGDAAELPEGFRAIEKPSGRRPVKESIREGAFSF
ncbi:MAG: nitroreductase family protein [Chthoniobacterales bacterium]